MCHNCIWDLGLAKLTTVVTHSSNHPHPKTLVSSNDRAPFSNMVPDYVIIGGEFSYKGYGGVIAAGFWGNDWEWRADVGWHMCGGGG